MSFERNKIYETKIYTIKDERELLSDNPIILKSIATLINPMLLRPFEINLQLRVFNIIRRLYYLYPDHRYLIVNPLNLVLSNIAIYSVSSEIYLNE